MLVEVRKDEYASNGIGGSFGEIYQHTEDQNHAEAPNLTPINRNELTPFQELLIHATVSDDVKSREKHFRLRRALQAHLNS